MMYLAMSYDHRIIDGREAVTFLVRVKEKRSRIRSGLLLGPLTFVPGLEAGSFVGP